MRIRVVCSVCRIVSSGRYVDAGCTLVTAGGCVGGTVVSTGGAVAIVVAGGAPDYTGRVNRIPAHFPVKKGKQGWCFFS